tara:strand:- start:9914 stop:11596 length:1683 start_codon:yes stop_codon:yes gene_type:complete
MDAAKGSNSGIGKISPFSTTSVSSGHKTQAGEKISGRVVRKRDRTKVAFKGLAKTLGGTLLPGLVTKPWTQAKTNTPTKEAALVKELAAKTTDKAKLSKIGDKTLAQRTTTEEKRPEGSLTPKDAFELITYFKDAFKSAQTTYKAIKAVNDKENKGNPLKLAGMLFMHALSENFGTIDKAVDTVADGIGFVVNLDLLAIEFAATTLGTMAGKLAKYGVKTVEFMLSGDLKAFKEDSKLSKRLEVGAFLVTKYGSSIPLYALDIATTPAKNLARIGINALLSATVRQKVKDGLNYASDRLSGKETKQGEITEETVQEVISETQDNKAVESKPMSLSQVENLKESVSAGDKEAIEKNLETLFTGIKDTDENGKELTGKEILKGLKSISDGPLDFAANALLYLKAKQTPDLEKGVETIFKGGAVVVNMANSSPAIQGVSNVFGTLVKYGVIGLSYAATGHGHRHIGRGAGDIASALLNHGMHFVIFSANHEGGNAGKEVPIIARMKAGFRKLIQKGLTRTGLYAKAPETKKEDKATPAQNKAITVNVTQEELLQAIREMRTKE